MRSILFVIVWSSGCAKAPAPTATAPAFSFAVVGDRTDEPNDVAWAATLAEVGALRPNLVVTVGDLVDDAFDRADWDRALGPLEALGIPFELTPGNHDIVDEATAAWFEERSGRAPFRSFDRGGVHFVIVDNAIGERWEDLAEGQRAWLEADLAANEGRPTAVFMHKPFWALRVAAGTPDPMHDLFVRHGVGAVFTGHWHNHGYERIDDIHYVIVGSSGGAHRPIQDVRRGSAFESVRVEVHDGRFHLQTVSGGQSWPIDLVRLSDANRLRALYQGKVKADLWDEADGGRLVVSVENVAEVPVTGTLSVIGGAWSDAEVSVDVAPRRGVQHRAEADAGQRAVPVAPAPARLPAVRRGGRALRGGRRLPA